MLLCIVIVCRCLSVFVDVFDGTFCLLFVVLVYVFIAVSSLLLLQLFIVGGCGCLVPFVVVCR